MATRGKPWDFDERKQRSVKALLADGWETKAIANRFAVNPNTLRNACSKAGIDLGERTRLSGAADRARAARSHIRRKGGGQ